MNISYSWLKALAPTITDSPHELAERLGMLGAPVDELIELGAGLSDIVVARVDEVLPHPNADRLQICVVRAGSDEVLQVVCGAPNVIAGGYYPFAPVGATLPGGLTIRKAKLRGQPSEGMLCSARELGLGRDADGLMALTGEWSPGAPLIEALSLDDARLVLDITPNRPDLLSHLGVARELAPRGAADVALPDIPGGSPVELTPRRAGAEGEIDGVELSIKDQEGCPRYMAAVIRGVSVAPSPEWLASRLRAVGVRPINNVVDATNYVLLEVGQPLHAFDLARLEGPAIAIRRAKDGERIRTLDGVDRKLEPSMLVIADRSRPIAVAGVMGGAETEVTDATTDLLIECALFDERKVRSTARNLGLSTDASFRFERGVDADGLPRALGRVIELVLAVAGGVVTPEVADLYPQTRSPGVVTVRTQTVERVLGLALSSGDMRELLEPIGFKVAGDSETMRVTVPGFRPDVTREIDVIEEIARRHGYDAFPESLPAFRPGNTPEDPRIAVEKRVRERLTGWGFLEARTTAFAPASDIRVPLLNPLSAEESHLRDLLAPGLLRRLEYNWSHGLRDIRLFEIGTVFLPGAPGGLPVEQTRVAAVFTGRRTPPHWTGDNEIWDVWDLSALLAELAQELGASGVEPGSHEHDAGLTTAAERLRVLGADGEAVGGGGRVSAELIDAPAWSDPVWICELVLPPSVEPGGQTYEPIAEHPAIDRDLALLVADDVSAREVGDVIRKSAGELLDSVWPFDLYEGKGIPEGTRSLAWRLRFRHPERTLTDAEIDDVISGVLASLESELDVHRR